MVHRLAPNVLGAGLFSLALLSTCAASAAEELVAPGAKVEQLAGGFAFTEGPACDAEGNVYFSDIPNARIHKWSLDGKLTTFRENSGGANGLYFDRAGNLVACEGGNRRVTSIAPGWRGDHPGGQLRRQKVEQPQRPLGRSARRRLLLGSALRQPGGSGAGRLPRLLPPPDRKRLLRVTDNLVKPNGVVGSADGKLLYITDAGDGKTYVYRIQRTAHWPTAS